MRPILFDYLSIVPHRDQLRHSLEILVFIRKRLYLILYFYTLTACTTIVAVKIHVEDLYYPIKLLYNTDNSISIVLYYLYKSSFLFAPLVCISDAVCFLTLSTFVTRDVYYIKYICNNFPVNKTSICQETIKQQLINLIKLHMQLKS